jgi:hypothetical protein
MMNEAIDQENACVESLRARKTCRYAPSMHCVLFYLYFGNFSIFDYEQPSQVRSIEVTKELVCVLKSITRKQLIAMGAKENKICIYNYNTNEKS